MKTESCRGKNSLKAIREQKKCQPFQDISTYFSEEEWAKLTTWQKSAYTYMKRNYIRMTSLGVTVNQPVFMRCKEHVKESPVEVKAKADGPDNKGVNTVRVNAWTHRLRVRKNRIIYEEISDPEEEEEDDDDNDNDDDED
ncbi:protein SSX1 [Phodopus roborovskii]|uniref:protein SSX1 n=1 Tax=Phodopus roborovskii TaxID=109678 RepID=UPI0021E483CD|nr:protein SSX1 [Phodopus roborovskii]